MRVISLKPLREFWERHPHAEQPLRQWYKTATFAELPPQFEQLVQMMPPQAVQDEVQYANTLAVIDRLMGVAKLTKGQALYLETLVQLVQAYEAEHHVIDTTGLTGLDSLKHLLEENQMNASDLARLLDVHPRLGSKIFKGHRSLTVDHIRKLAERFKVSPGLFLD